jgi:4-amino-4-deoxy-L-arabinose transferase-like glycosyltransferase
MGAANNSSLNIQSYFNKRTSLLLILLLAILIRLWGISHDLPYSYFPDEAHFVKRALSFGSGDLNPHWFHKPAFYMYWLFVEYGVFYVIGLLLESWSSVSEFAVAFIHNPSSFYLIGRLTTVAFSVAGIWGVYRIGERHFGKNVGLLAALFLGLTFGDVESSRSIKADIPTACFGIWSFYFLLNYLENGHRRPLILASAFAGIGTATKYYLLPMLLPLCTAALLPIKNRMVTGGSQRWIFRLALIAVVLAAFWGFYFLSSPYNFIDPLGRQWTFKPFSEAISRGIEFLTGEPSTIHREAWNIQRGKGNLTSGMSDYIFRVFSPEGMGFVIAMFGFLGIGLILISREQKKTLFGLYAMIFLIISAWMYPGRALPRHQTPLYPFLAVAGGFMVIHLLNSSKKGRLFAYAAVLLVLLNSLFYIAPVASDLTKRDTRNIAKYWIETNIPDDTKILIDENGPPLLMNEKKIDSILKKSSTSDSNGQFTAHYDTFLQYQRLAAMERVSYEIYKIRFPWWLSKFEKYGYHELNKPFDRDHGNPLRPVGVESYSYYIENDVKYAIVHSDKYEKYFTSSNVSRNFPEFAEFYKELFDRGILLKEFYPDRNSRGPVVKVFRLDGSST